MTSQYVATACVVGAAAVFLYVAEQLIRGERKRCRSSNVSPNNLLVNSDLRGLSLLEVEKKEP